MTGRGLSLRGTTMATVAGKSSEVSQQLADIRHLFQMTNHLNRRLHGVIRQRPHRMAGAVGKLRRELLNAQAVLGGAERSGGPTLAVAVRPPFRRIVIALVS